MPSDLSDLIRQIAFYKAGGQQQGTRDIDKIDQIFQTLGQTSNNLSNLAKQALERKRQELAIQKEQPISTTLGIPTAQQQSVMEAKAKQDFFNKVKGVQDYLRTVPEEAQSNLTPEELQAHTGEGIPQYVPPENKRAQFEQKFGFPSEILDVPSSVAEKLIELKLKKDLLSQKQSNEIYSNPKTGARYGSLAEVPQNELSQVYKVSSETGFKAETAKQLQKEKQAQTEYSPEAIEYASQQIYINPSPDNMKGILGAFGGGGNRGLILKRASEIAKENGETAKSVALRGIALGADKSELKKTQDLRGVVAPFEKTAKANGDRILEMIDELDPARFPILQNLFLKGETRIAGDPVASDFLLRMKTYAFEYARVISTISGVTTDAARNEVDQILLPAFNKETLKRIIPSSYKDMENRINGLDSTVSEIKERMAGYTIPKSNFISNQKVNNYSLRDKAKVFLKMQGGAVTDDNIDFVIKNGFVK